MIILPKHLVHAQLTRQTKISQGRLNQLKQEKNNNTVLHGHTAFTTMVLVYIDIQHHYRNTEWLCEHAHAIYLQVEQHQPDFWGSSLTFKFSPLKDIYDCST